MNVRTARLFVLMTSLLAFAAVITAGALGLRFLRTKANISAAMDDDRCPQPAKAAP